MSDSTTASGWEIKPFGDSAVLVIFGNEQDPAINARVHALAALVRQLGADGAKLGVPVPAYSSLLVPYDPLTLDLGAATGLLLDAIVASAGATTMPEGSAPVEIPTRYGGDAGPDLQEVADYHGISPERVIELHTASVYRVYLLGFAPGFAYLGPLPPELVTPRRDTPRTRVPAGSVAIAGGQTGVYPLSTPGGWRLLGRTDVPLWEPQREQPAFLKPGDFVRFVAI